jgi:hypothetical protein
MFDVKDTKCLVKVITDFIGEPTETELKEMIASNKLMSNLTKPGQSDEEIYKKRFKRLDQFLKN